MKKLLVFLVVILCLTGCSNAADNAKPTEAETTKAATEAAAETTDAATEPAAETTDATTEAQTEATFAKIDFEEVASFPWDYPYVCDPMPIKYSLAIPTKEVAVAVADGILSGLELGNLNLDAYQVYYVTATESWIVGYLEPPLCPSLGVYIELSAKTGELLRVFWG